MSRTFYGVKFGLKESLCVKDTTFYNSDHDKMLKKDAWQRVSSCNLQLAFCNCWCEKRPFIGNLSNSDANIVNNSNKFPIFTPIQPFQFS